MKKLVIISGIALVGLFSCNHQNSTTENGTQVLTAASPDTSATEPNGVYFVNLKDGDTVKSPVIVDMGVRGMSVEPAGEIHEGKGHHHLIIDAQFVAKDTVVPTDERHIHFGKGQTADTLALSPGNHTLTLQFANGHHQSYGKDWSKTISITVVK